MTNNLQTTVLAQILSKKSMTMIMDQLQIRIPQCLCRREDESQELATNVGARRSNVMASSLAPTVPCTAMVGNALSQDENSCLCTDSAECTYDKPSNRRRNPAPQYIEALEAKLIRAEALLRKFVPNVDLNDPNLDPAVQQEFQNRERQRLQAARQKREEVQQAIDPHEARITSMIETIGQLDLDEGGGWDFRGTSSGAVFLGRMKEHFGGLLGADQTVPFLPRPSRVPGFAKLDSPGSTTGVSSPGEADSFTVYNLPSKERAQQLSSSALTCATALLRIVHVPSFSKKLEDIYGKSSVEFDKDDNRFLALFYAVMAVGAMYNITEEELADQDSYKEAAAEGCVMLGFCPYPFDFWQWKFTNTLIG